jgi:hypothetical protein
MAQKRGESSGLGRSVIKHKPNENFGSQLDLAEAQSSCAGENSGLVPFPSTWAWPTGRLPGFIGEVGTVDLGANNCMAMGAG